MTSIFTKIIQREIPATIRYEDEDFIAFDDINPIAPIHVLVVPKESHKFLEEIALDDTQFHAQLLIVARKVAQSMGIQQNYKLFMNVGAQVQAVKHIHMHVVGGWTPKKSQQELDAQTVDFLQTSIA